MKPAASCTLSPGTSYASSHHSPAHGSIPHLPASSPLLFSVTKLRQRRFLRSLFCLHEGPKAKASRKGILHVFALSHFNFPTRPVMPATKANAAAMAQVRPALFCFSPPHSSYHLAPCSNWFVFFVPRFSSNISFSTVIVTMHRRHVRTPMPLGAQYQHLGHSSQKEQNLSMITATPSHLLHHPAVLRHYLRIETTVKATLVSPRTTNHKTTSRASGLETNAGTPLQLKTFPHPSLSLTLKTPLPPLSNDRAQWNSTIALPAN